MSVLNLSKPFGGSYITDVVLSCPLCTPFVDCTACASSQCYWDEIMLLQVCMSYAIKMQFNENTDQNGVLFPTKCVERVLMFICKTHNTTLL